MYSIILSGIANKPILFLRRRTLTNVVFWPESGMTNVTGWAKSEFEPGQNHIVNFQLIIYYQFVLSLFLFLHELP